MPEENISYREPIEESDTRDKFKPELNVSRKVETPSTSENQTESSVEIKGESEVLLQKISASSTPGQLQDEDRIKDDAEKVAKTDADSQVKQLIDLAMTKGVVHAIKVAKHLNDFYVLDQVHDDLANRLRDALREKGMLKD